MTPVHIQYEIKRRGYTQRRLARELGYDEMSISRCINRKPHAVTAPLVRKISEFIERDPLKVFPEYFKKRPLWKRKPKES